MTHVPGVADVTGPSTEQPSIGSTSPTGRTRRRPASIALRLLEIVTSAAVLGAGAATLAGAPQPVQIFDAIGLGDWFRLLTGVLQLTGALGLLVPRLTGPTALALVGMWSVATTVHLVGIGGNPVPAGVYLVLSAVIAGARRDGLRPLARLLMRIPVPLPQFFGPPWLRLVHGLVGRAGVSVAVRALRAPRPGTGGR